MTTPEQANELDALARDVRIHVFQRAAESGEVPQAASIAERLGRPITAIQAALRQLADGKVLILAPNDANIWAANPFCAVPSGVRVESGSKRYWGICIWDALGIAAALGRDATIQAPCGDCGDALHLEVKNGKLTRSEGIVHFAIPAHHWWDNIGFT